MKKTTKSLLITSLILFCAGLVLTLGSFLAAVIMKVDVFGVESVPRVSVSKEYSLSEILADSPDSDYVKYNTGVPFTGIEIISYVGKVEILPTEEETHFSLTKGNPDNLSVRVIGSKLTIADQREVGFMGFFVGEHGFSFKGLRQIFGPGNTANPSKVMTLYLNPNDQVDQITVRANVGNVRIESISGKTITLHSSIGDMKLTNLSFDRIEIDKTLGDVTLDGNHYNALNASVKFGKVKASIPNGLDQSTVIDIWTGESIIKTDAPLSSYKLKLSASVGSVSKNGKNSGKSLQEYSEAANRISATVVFGKISISGGDTPRFVEVDPDNPEAAPDVPASADNAPAIVPDSPSEEPEPVDEPDEVQEADPD